MSLQQKIGHNIIRLRTKKGITQEHLALDAEVSVTFLRAIEHGKANPSLRILQQIAAAMQEPVSAILCGIHTDHEEAHLDL